MLLGGHIADEDWKDFEEGVRKRLKSLEIINTPLMALRETVNDGLNSMRKILLEARRKGTLVM